MVESLVIEVPVELVEGLDDIVMLMGFRSREEFALVAARWFVPKFIQIRTRLSE
jgi:metal-responsive CopG/Arc/MetJ family transcriptional regulator